MAIYSEEYEDGDYSIKCDKVHVSNGHVVARLNEGETAHQVIGELCQIIIGYEPVKYTDLIAKAKEHAEIAKRYQQNKQVASLFDAIRELNEMADDIESDA